MTSSPLAYSVVAPLHNEAGNVEPLLAAILAAMERLPGEYEVILVDDGSDDGTGDRLERLAATEPRLRPLRLRRNYGQSAALTAGFAHAGGEVILTLDGDLQNDPADFGKLLDLLHEPIRVVSGWRKRRRDGFWLRALPSTAANALIRWLTGLPTRDTGCCLKAYRAEVVRGVSLPAGMHRFLPAAFGVRAGEFAQVEVSHRPRQWGRSHYGLSRLFRVLWDLCALPLIQRQRWRRAAGWLGAVGGAGGLLCLAGALLWPRIGLAGGSLLLTAGGLLGVYCLAARDGLLRFARAQSEGVYQLRQSPADRVDAGAETALPRAEYGRQIS